MADDYIDYEECLEYGDHFQTEAKQLTGLSPIVDVNALVAYVATTQKAVADQLSAQGIKLSDLRGDRKDVGDAAPKLRRVIEQFHRYLGSVDDALGIDREAFFPGGKLGNISQMKPADLVGKAKKVLDGFAAPANAALPDAATWQAKLTAARDALANATSSKGSSRTVSIQGTAELVAAREAFLKAYNGVAKRVVAGLLVHLDRKDELRLYFKDLQVNESSSTPAAPATPAPATPATPPPAAPATPAPATP